MKEEVTDDELATVVNSVDFFSTVRLNPAIVGPLVAPIAKVVNHHRHVIARLPGKDMTDQYKKSVEIEHEAVIKKVHEVFENQETIEKILSEHPKEKEKISADAFRGNLVE